MSKVVQVRDVPDQVHEELSEMAAAAGMSLNQFLHFEFERIARRGRNAEIFQRAATREGRRLSSAEIVGSLRAERDALE